LCYVPFDIKWDKKATYHFPRFIPSFKNNDLVSEPVRTLW